MPRSVFQIFILLFAASIPVVLNGQVPYIPETVDPLTEQWRWHTYPQLSGKGITCMIEDKKGTLWFGGNGVIIRYDGYMFQSYSKDAGVPKGQITSMTANREGEIFACVREVGIYKYSKSRWEKIFPQNGFIGPNTVIVDFDNHLWTSTDKGIVRLLGKNTEIYTPLGKRNLNSYIEKLSFSEMTGLKFGYWQLVWDNEFLYVQVKYKDENKLRDSKYNHDDDCIELHIDVRNKKDSVISAGNFFYQFRVFDKNIVEQYQNAVKGVMHEFSYANDSTSLQIKIPWKVLSVNPLELKKLGFDVMVQDDDDGGERDIKLAWASVNSLAFKNPSLLGEINLNDFKSKKPLTNYTSANFWQNKTQHIIDNVVLFPAAISACSDSEGNVYMGFTDGKIVRIPKEDPKIGIKINFNLLKNKIDLFGWSSLSIKKDGSLLVATHNPNFGFLTYSNNVFEETKLSSWFGGGEDSYHSAIQTTDGVILVGGFNKLAIKRNNNWVLYQNPRIPISVDVPIEFMYEAKDGKIWIIERGNRVWRIDASFNKWETFKNLLFQTEEHTGRQWFIASIGNIVSYYKGVWLSFNSSNGLLDAPVRIIQCKNGEIFVAGSSKGKAAVSIFRQGKWFTKQHPGFSWGISPKAITEGVDGTLFLGSNIEGKDINQSGGILCYKCKSNNFDDEINWRTIYFPNIPSEFVYCLAATPDSGFMGGVSKAFKYNNGRSDVIDIGSENIFNTISLINNYALFGTQSNGLYKLEGKKITNFTNENGLPSNTILDICPISSQSYYVLTDNGICYYDGQTYSSKLFPEEIEKDANNSDIRYSYSKQIWINSIPREWKLRSLHAAQTRQYITKSTRFTPDTLAPETRITSSVNKIVVPSELIVSWEGADPWGETPDELLEFSYRLNNQPWKPFVRTRQIVIKNIKAGSYTIEVRARDNEFNIDNTPASMAFEVFRPVYLRTWFISMILLFLGIITYLIYLLIKNRINHAMVIENVKREKIREIDIARVKFFTNISHELRTPLTLILSYTNKLSEVINALPEKSVQHFELLMQNTSRLHRIINQVLDLRKLQVGELKLDPVFDDLVTFSKKCLDAFIMDAADRKIELRFTANYKHFFTHFDNIKLEHIIYNLLSNALKFTEKGFVAFELKIEDNQFHIIVEDTGIGIGTNDLSKIFNRFYQADDTHKKKFQGTGVGLSLVKEIIELYGGKISVLSEINKGSVFSVILPILKYDKNHKKSDTKNTENNEPEELKINTTIINEQTKKTKSKLIEKPILLIVEDNTEIRNHLREELENDYIIYEGEDGIIGKDLAIQIIPDLIISDVMMPRLDGNELCTLLKHDERTSHIPIIILTVLDSEHSHISSLKSGADDHINKPFSILLVKARIANLLLSRKQLRDKSTKDFLMKPTESEEVSLDDMLLKKCHEAINDNLSDPDFDVSRLADKLNITQKQLYRKLTSLLNITPNQYIRTLKLNRAAELLIKTDYTISQITYEVGFQDLRYFRNIFKEQFGCTPSEYILKHKSG